MLLRTSRSSSPLMLIGIVLLLGVLFLPSFQHSVATPDATREGVLFSTFHALSQHTLYSPLLAMAFVILIVVFQGRISQKYILISNRNYLTGLLFVALCSSIAELKTFAPVYPAALLLILALSRFINSYRREGDSKEYFEGSLYIGLAGMFYPPSIIFIVSAWIALILFRSFRWREWVFVFLGIGTPYLFLASYYFLTGHNLLLGTKPFFAYSIQHTNKLFDIPQMVYMGFVVLLILAASFYSNRRVNAQKVQTSKSYSLFFYVFLICIGAYFFIPGVGKEIIVITCIPLAFLLALYFSEVKRNWLVDVVFDLIIIGSIVLSFVG